MFVADLRLSIEALHVEIIMSHRALHPGLGRVLGDHPEVSHRGTIWAVVHNRLIFNVASKHNHLKHREKLLTKCEIV
jgi:hypothetical protein